MDAETFFTALRAPDDELFFSRGDPYDVRFGEVVRRGRRELDEANVVLLGCPQDEGVRRNQGRPGARHAPREIRRALYKLPVGEQHRSLRLLDAGDLPLTDSLETTHQLLHELVSHLLGLGKPVVVLGGGNDISYPDCSAAARHAQRLLAINVDRHFDVRLAEARNSGTPYRQLLDGNTLAPQRFHEFAISRLENPPAYRDYLEEIGANVHPLEEVQATGVRRSIDAILSASDGDAIFWGFDLDVVRGMEAPGVSAPGPLGLTAAEIGEVADAVAADPRSLVLEISEVNPEYDRDNLTSKLAAQLIVRALAGVGATEST